MAYRQTEFAVGEWYHCYTRSITGRTVFDDVRDFQRFTEALYLCNGTKTIKRGAISRPTHERMLLLDRGGQLIDLAAYAIMPNHFHLLLQENRDGGISTFMQKLGTSYSMYYNVKKMHIGNVFKKPFRAKHIADERYLQRVLQYIHLNPIELFERGWKQGLIRHPKSVENKVLSYRWSSLPDYESIVRVENAILGKEAMTIFDERPPLRSIIAEAAEYYAELEGL